MTDHNGDLVAARTAAGALSIPLSDGTTAYHLHGERGPWVVLVHGLITPMDPWAPMAEALAAAGFRVLRYDQLGRGLSDRPDVAYTPALYVRQLRELLTKLSIASAHVVDWSMGSIITSRLALERPDLVARRVLIAPALFVEQPRAAAVVQRLPFGDRIVAAIAGRTIERLPAEHLRYPERQPHYVDCMRVQLRFPGLGRSFASTVRHFAWREGPGLDAVGAHDRPVLLIWGDDDPATLYRNAPRVQALFPRAELMTIAGARHAPHLEHRDEVHAAITAFLTRA